MNEHAPPSDEGDRFETSLINRRRFLSLSATSIGAFSGIGGSAANVAIDKMTTEYQYVLKNTPTESVIPTLVTFSEEAGVEVFDKTIDTETHTTIEPKPAGYAKLTTSQAKQAAVLPTAETLSYLPGANPFWRLGYYPIGVFPNPSRCVDYIDYQEMIAGLNYLESKHDERLNFYSIGQSPGWYNFFTDRKDPKDIYVAEVTNNIDDQAAFRDKEKVLFSLSLHGLERPGVEAGSRFIENLLEGREDGVEPLLNELVLLFVYANPDGWVARYPRYDDGTTGLAPNIYRRGNASGVDTNRQYPNIGFVHPLHFPAEPNGSNYEDNDPGIDLDVPDGVRRTVPDALAIAEHFRDYENLNYGADLHSFGKYPVFVTGLIGQDQFDHRQLHDVYQMNRNLDETLEESLTTWNTAANTGESVPMCTSSEGLSESSGTSTKLGHRSSDPCDQFPQEAFNFTAIWDILNYTPQGNLIDWLSHPESMGGLGMITTAFEMAGTDYDWAAYNPEIASMQVLGYTTVIRTFSEFAAQASDTPNTEDEFETTIKTGGIKTAFVTTDTLTRSSEQLNSTDTKSDSSAGTSSQGNSSSAKAQRNYETTKRSVKGGETMEFTISVPSEMDTLALSVYAERRGLIAPTLYAPDGKDIRSYDPTSPERIPVGTVSWTVSDPDQGEWTAVVETVLNDGSTDFPKNVETEPPDITVTLSHNPLVEPREPEIFYPQRRYKASPFVFFDKEFISTDDPLRRHEVERDYNDVTDAPVDGLTIVDVKAGYHHNYDSLIVIHNEGDDDDKYLDELEKFVNEGGNLVVTDSGVHLLGLLDTDLTKQISASHVQTDSSFQVAHLGSKNSNHPLMDGTRSIQEILWKTVPLGYSGSPGEAPMALVDKEAFKNAGGRVAGTTGGEVAAGSLLSEEADGTIRDVVQSDDGSIQVISSLLPPAYQSNHHPFGVLDYALSFLGHTMLTNSLGYVQKRYIEDKEIASFGGESTY